MIAKRATIFTMAGLVNIYSQALQLGASRRHWKSVNGDCTVSLVYYPILFSIIIPTGLQDLMASHLTAL
jgi:hypothetical protein